MFDLLKGGKATLGVALDRPSGSYYPGQIVHATVLLQSDKDLTVREGRVALVRHEEYQYRYRHQTRDSHGHVQTSTGSRWATDEREVNRQIFLQEGVIPGGSVRTFQFNLAVPPDAPPTCAGGKIIKLKWLVKATLDRKMAADVNSEAEVTVLMGPRGQATGPGQYGMSNEPEEAQVTLALPRAEWRVGETIGGQLVIRSQKDFDVTEIRVELVRQESVPREEGNTAEQTQTVKVAAQTELRAGDSLSFPFSVAIPAPGPASVRTRYGSITWLLKGVLARRLRRDTTVQEEVFVYTGSPDSGPAP